MNAECIKTADLKLAIIGLGYVGLPLAIEFGKNRPVARIPNHLEIVKQRPGFHSARRKCSSTDGG